MTDYNDIPYKDEDVDPEEDDMSWLDDYVTERDAQEPEITDPEEFLQGWD